MVVCRGGVLLASRLPTVICAGVLSPAKRVLIFADGVFSAEFAPRAHLSGADRIHQLSHGGQLATNADG